MSPEVRLILNGWLDNDSQLVLVGSFGGFTCALRCQVKKLENLAMSLVTESGMLVVDFSIPETEIRYSEPREFPEMLAMLSLPDEHRFNSSLTFLFAEATESMVSASLCLIEIGHG